jgi:hypothetical protein
VRHLPFRCGAIALYVYTLGGPWDADFSAFHDGFVLTVNAGLPYIPAIRLATRPPGAMACLSKHLTFIVNQLPISCRRRCASTLFEGLRATEGGTSRSRAV